MLALLLRGCSLSITGFPVKGLELELDLQQLRKSLASLGMQQLCLLQEGEGEGSWSGRGGGGSWSGRGGIWSRRGGGGIWSGRGGGGSWSGRGALSRQELPVLSNKLLLLLCILFVRSERNSGRAELLAAGQGRSHCNFSVSVIVRNIKKLGPSHT